MISVVTLLCFGYKIVVRPVHHGLREFLQLMILLTLFACLAWLLSSYLLSILYAKTSGKLNFVWVKFVRHLPFLLCVVLFISEIQDTDRYGY